MAASERLQYPQLTTEPNSVIRTTLLYNVIYYLVRYEDYQIIQFCKSDLNYLNN
jgi:hypothetical protein